MTDAEVRVSIAFAVAVIAVTGAIMISDSQPGTRVRLVGVALLGSAVGVLGYI